MAAESHALLGASSAKRWLECPPSARATEAAENEASPFAEEGSRAHLLAEYKLKGILGLPQEPLPDDAEFDPEMEECTDDYAQFCAGLWADAGKGSVPAVEARVDFSRYVPEGFGTADFALVGDGFIHIVDLKYGKGVPVSAVENPQMKLYAIGAIAAYGDLFEIDDVRMTIFQPRLGNVSTFETTRKELEEWAENYVKPRADLAWKGLGEFKEGEWCRFCRIRARCRKRAEANLELAKLEFKDPATLTDAEIAEVLSKSEELSSWANDVREYALAEALKGKRFPGWKVVEGKSTRRFAEEEAVAKAVLALGKDPYRRSLLTITDMTKLLGKKGFDDALGGLVEKPRGKPTLAPESDKRPEFAVDSARNDFNDNKEE